MEYKLKTGPVNGVQQHQSDGGPGGIEVCSPGEFQQIQSDIEGFTTSVSDAGFLKRRKKDSEDWTVPKVKFLLSVLEGTLPKHQDAINPSCKLWGEIHKRVQDAGYEMTQKQVASKCLSLIRQYERVCQHKLETGDNKEFAYRTELERVYAQWPKKVSREDNLGAFRMDEDQRTHFTRSDKLVTGIEEDDDKIEYCHWPDEKVKLLLSSVEEMLPKIGESPDLPKKIKMWEQITHRLREKGYPITGIQVQNKYSSLIRQYRRMKARATQNGKPLSCPYKEAIERILQIPPPVTQDFPLQASYIDEMNSYAENPPEFMSDDSLMQDTTSSSQFQLANTADSNLPSSSVVEEIRKIRQMKEHYYKEKKEYLNRKKLHLERKEEHMRRKEALLRAVLIKLEEK